MSFQTENCVLHLLYVQYIIVCRGTFSDLERLKVVTVDVSFLLKHITNPYDLYSSTCNKSPFSDPYRCKMNLYLRTYCFTRVSVTRLFLEYTPVYNV